MKIEIGKSYKNGRGEICGPIEQKKSGLRIHPGLYVDQMGLLYNEDGVAWNAGEAFAGNLVEEVVP